MPLARSIACLTIPAVVSAAAVAGPLRADRLPADVGWVMHADLEYARTTRLGAFALEEIRREMAEKPIADLKLDPGVDIKDLTLFGWPDKAEGQIFMATMNDAAERVFEHVSKRPGFERLMHEGRAIHSWLEGEHGDVVRIYAMDLARGGEHIVYATDRMDVLLRVFAGQESRHVAVDRGEVPPHDRAAMGHARDAGVDGGQVVEARLPVEAAPGAILYFAATEVRCIGDHEPAAQIIRNADLIVVNIGENERDAFVQLSVSAKGEEEARNIAQVLQGLAAMAQFIIRHDDKDLAWLRQLAATLTFTAEGRNVNALCRFDPAIVIESHAGRGDEAGEGANENKGNNPPPAQAAPLEDDAHS